MKKLLCLVIATVTAFSLLGCGYDDSSTNIAKVNCKKYVTQLGDTSGIVVYADKSEVSDEIVEEYINYILDNEKELKEVSGRAVKNGDVANIDYEGKKDGVAFEGGTAQGYDLEIGSGTFIDGFEDGVVGMKVGETKNLDLTFPENYTNTELAGADVVFTVKLNSIQEYEVPELTDEFANEKSFGECNTVEEFNQYAKETLESTAEKNYQSDIEAQLLQAYTDRCAFVDDVPSGLYDYYRNMLMDNDESLASQYGMGLELFVTAYYGVADIDEYYEQINDNAKNSVREAMISYMLGKELGLLVDDKELEDEINNNYLSFGFASADAFKAAMDIEDYRAYLVEKKVIEYLKGQAQVLPTSEKPEE